MPENPPSPTIAEAVAILRDGGLLAIPTETVYGLAADARNPEAIARIFALKGRPADHPLIVHIADADRLDDWAVTIPEAARKLAAAFWPGPLTLILKKRAEVADAVTGGQDTVGLRSPDHALTLALLKAFGGGLAAPSANRFGRISPTSAGHVRDEFGENAPPILDGGPCPVGIESTIVDLSQRPPRILREGHIRREQLLPFLPELQSGLAAASPRVSGSLDAHYAPRTQMRMLEREPLIEAATDDPRCVLLALDGLPPETQGLSLPAQPEAYAHGLYAALRELDARDATCILIEQPPSGPDWLAVNDRIKRALAGAGL
ncbi:L-threonylcarbamoyladenylate synthase [Arenimonas sp. GDDSR-1]|uniref:L-threonylcarbamoyladenylate synthase n=1 Tax=Arenimonas sp. GDDSR-1 TaxID=2950125 RepID=UPI0026346924|nr:L-threonylcarbamoyladenylate synthase [Arenimonas sp. GDDSR-1]